jgi:hypothetical protein
VSPAAPRWHCARGRLIIGPLGGAPGLAVRGDWPWGPQPSSTWTAQRGRGLGPLPPAPCPRLALPGRLARPSVSWRVRSAQQLTMRRPGGGGRTVTAAHSAPGARGRACRRSQAWARAVVGPLAVTGCSEVEGCWPPPAAAAGMSERAGRPSGCSAYGHLHRRLGARPPALSRAGGVPSPSCLGGQPGRLGRPSGCRWTVRVSLPGLAPGARGHRTTCCMLSCGARADVSAGPRSPPYDVRACTAGGVGAVGRGRQLGRGLGGGSVWGGVVGVGGGWLNPLRGAGACLSRREGTAGGAALQHVRRPAARRWRAVRRRLAVARYPRAWLARHRLAWVLLVVTRSAALALVAVDQRPSDPRRFWSELHPHRGAARFPVSWGDSQAGSKGTDEVRPARLGEGRDGGGELQTG